tara:strand:- start:10363 stop:11889 length:1527 start_codon:yes stop_codon:yes gene_type:complete
MPQATGTIQFRRSSYNSGTMGAKVLAEGEPGILVDHRMVIGQDRGGSLSTIAQALADNRAFAYHNGEAHQFGGATNRVQLEVKSHPTQTASRATVNITNRISGVDESAVAIFPDRGHNRLGQHILHPTSCAMVVNSGAVSSTTMKSFEVKRGDDTVFSVSNSGCTTISPTTETSTSPSLGVLGSGHASQTDAFRVEEHDGNLMMKITNSQTASATNFINCKELIIAGRDPNDPADDSSEQNASASLPRTHSLKSGRGPSHSGASTQGTPFHSFPYYSIRTEQPQSNVYNSGQAGSTTHVMGHLMLLTAPTNDDNNKPFIFRKVDGPNLGAGNGASFVVQFGTSNPSPRIFCGPVNVESDRFGPDMIHPNGSSAAIAQAAAGRLIIDDKSTVVRSLVTDTMKAYSLDDSGALDARVLAREELIKAFELIFSNPSTGVAEEDTTLPNPVSESKFFAWRIVFDVFTTLDVGNGKPHITGITTTVSKNLNGGTQVGSGSGDFGNAGFFVRTR